MEIMLDLVARQTNLQKLFHYTSVKCIIIVQTPNFLKKKRKTY